MSIFGKRREKTSSADTWARPEMNVTFRAEIMPGKDREERTFRIATVRSNGRVILHDFLGEHRQGAFEEINFLREKANEDQKP